MAHTNIENLSRPGESPVDKDIVKITHANGATETKMYFEPIDPGPKYQTLISRAQFLDRFDLPELTAFYVAAKTDETLEVLKDQVLSRQTVNLESELATTAKTLLVSSDILTPDRADIVFEIKQ